MSHAHSAVSSLCTAPPTQKLRGRGLVTPLVGLCQPRPQSGRGFGRDNRQEPVVNFQRHPSRPRVSGRGPVARNGRGATNKTCVGGDTPTSFKMAAIGSGKFWVKSMEICLQTSRPSIFALAGAAWAKLGEVSGVGVIYHPHEWEMHRAWSCIVQRSEFADA